MNDATHPAPRPSSRPEPDVADRPGRRRATLALIAGATAVVGLRPAVGQAQAFPSRPIRILVPFNAGSGSDEASRVYGEIVSKQLGQPVLVENRPGGSGLLAIQGVKQAPADGYTIMLASNSPMAVNPVVIKDLSYDPFKDFRPLHGLTVGPATFVVKGDSPHKTIADLVAAARQSGRPLTVGNYSAGYQLVGSWLGTAAKVPVTHVPYKGGAQMIVDVLGGQIDVGINDFGGVAEQHRAGKVRILAITGGKRDAKFPDIPTMTESGFPEFETYVWASLFVRAETPDAVVDVLAGALRTALLSPEGKAYQAKRPGEPLMMGPQELGAFHRREYERFKKVAEAAGIKPQ